MIEMGERDAAVWNAALPYLQTRANDAHSLYSYGIARALLMRVPEGDERIVLPAIILHDTGWSTVDEQVAINAIAPDRDGSLHHVVIQHEKEGARIARDILTDLRFPAADIDEICDIIDGHDTRLTAISVNDSLVKDADKVWRVSPHGIGIAVPRFGLTREESAILNAQRAYDDLFNDAAKAMSLAFLSWECMTESVAMTQCYDPEDS
ncbi:MAG: HD domain-containing protein [Actinomycetota bacterium]|nr:HD domain-containing protein [Actinomycetota bacterium]